MAYLSAIIASGGKSTRMNGINKQLLELDGVPVVIRTIQICASNTSVSEIIVVCASQMIEELQMLIKKFKISKKIIIVEGGATRQQSVFNGVNHCDIQSEYFMIHDGARPFISNGMIENALQLAYQKKAVIVAVPSKDTVKICDEQNKIIATPNRTDTYLAQTPQIFCAKLYKKAMQQAVQNRKDFTDDAQLIESFGESVFIAQGCYTNIKITTIDDIAFAQSILKKGENIK